MPYRRLPNTDKARLHALEQAVESSMQHSNFTHVISYNTYSKAKSLLQTFAHIVTEHKEFLQQVNEARRESKYMRTRNEARLYLFHFIQVLFFAMCRGEIPPQKRRCYGLSDETFIVPDMSTDLSLLTWGKKIIEGERRRLNEGGIPIYNPTIAKVKTFYDLFKQNYEQITMMAEKSAEKLKAVSHMRPQIDDFILALWNEIEATFRGKEEEKDFLSHCSEYGIIYYYRPHEKEKTMSEETESEEEE